MSDVMRDDAGTQGRDDPRIEERRDVMRDASRALSRTRFGFHDWTLKALSVRSPPRPSFPNPYYALVVATCGQALGLPIGTAHGEFCLDSQLCL